MVPVPVDPVPAKYGPDRPDSAESRKKCFFNLGVGFDIM